MNAADVMSSPVVTVSPATPVPEIARLLQARRISGVPVVDEREGVVGVVSEADLRRAHGGAPASTEPHASWWQRLMHAGGASPQQRARLQAMRAADIMTRGAVSVAEYTPVAEVAAVLVERQIHRVLVLSRRQLVGIITGADMAQALLALSGSSSEGLREDAAIEARLGAALEAQAWWNPIASHVSVDKGIAWFRGTVETEAARHAARRLAQRTPGVRGVLDDRVCAPASEPWSSAQAVEYVIG